MAVGAFHLTRQNMMVLENFLFAITHLTTCLSDLIRQDLKNPINFMRVSAKFFNI